MTLYDVAIVGAGPGGVACAIKATERGLKYVLLEKGKGLFQGIVDSYPRGKRVYPTIPTGEQGPFPIEDLMPDPNNDPVEEYLAKIEKCVNKHKLTLNLNEEFLDIKREQAEFDVITYAIGGAISPAYIEIEEQGSFKERKHSNLIFTAVRDAVEAVEHIAASSDR